MISQYYEYLHAFVKFFNNYFFATPKYDLSFNTFRLVGGND